MKKGLLVDEINTDITPPTLWLYNSQVPMQFSMLLFCISLMDKYINTVLFTLCFKKQCPV